MSMKTLEKAILMGARELYKNPKLKMNEIQEWSTSKVEAQPGEISEWIPDPGVWVAVKKESDKRL